MEQAVQKSILLIQKLLKEQGFQVQTNNFSIMKYQGMTVNERLFVSGLMDAFDKAVKEKDIPKVKSILEAVELNEESIKLILKAFGLLADASD